MCAALAGDHARICFKNAARESEYAAKGAARAEREAMSSELKKLVEKFRQLGDTQETTGFPNSAKIAWQCADELEAALAAEQPKVSEEQVREVLQDVVDLGLHGLWSGKRSTVDKARALLSPSAPTPYQETLDRVAAKIAEPAPTKTNAKHSISFYTSKSEMFVPATEPAPSDVGLVEKWNKEECQHSECDNAICEACAEKHGCATELAAWLPAHDAQVCKDALEELHELEIMLGYAIQNRCACCGWPLAKSANEGCVPGNCSYRPQGSPFQETWHKRAKKIAAIRALAGKPGPSGDSKS
jgi:sulfur relay (sulfurtransferase) complex TusBCD TusD component (DsrE family)